MSEYNYSRFHPSNFNYGRFDGPEAGAEMLDFELYSLDGKAVNLRDYRGKWLVLETGSLTCPMYVKNINSIKSVIQKYPDVEFLVVYVREAHIPDLVRGRMRPWPKSCQSPKRARKLMAKFDPYSWTISAAPCTVPTDHFQTWCT